MILARITKPIHRFCCLTLLLLGAAFLCGCAALSAFSSSTVGTVVINEVVSTNKRSLTDAAYGSPDWIEIYNAGSSPVNLSGYGLSDNMRDFHKYTFPDVVLAPGAYLLLYATDDNGQEGSADRTGFGLSKSGDFLFLTDAYYGLVQQMEVPQLITDVSYARRENGTYGYCASPTPGAQNTGAIQSSLDALFGDQNLDDLSISEVLPRTGEGYPWLELHNGGSGALRLENYYVSDSEINPMRWQLPECTLEAGEYALVYLSGLDQKGDEFHADFKIGKDDTTVLLTDLTGRVLTKLSWDAALPAGISVVAGEGTLYTGYTTPGAENSAETFTNASASLMDGTDPVRISEVLRRNKLSITDMDGDRPDWVEIHNASSADVSLKGYYLSDNPDNLFKWALPDQVIPAGGYAVIFLSGKDRRGVELHASFSLGDDENGVYFTSLDGLKTDAVEVPTDLGANVSVGRDSGGNERYFAQPTPGYENGYGYETADAIGFFHKDGVYISEVCAAHAAKTAENDWIELYNGGAEAVDLGGWRLSDDPDKPEKFTIHNLILAPNDYAVIETTSNSTRQKDGVGTFGLSQDGETVVLTNLAGEEVDAFETGALREGVSAGRIEGDETVRRVFFKSITKKAKNNIESAVTGYSPEPVFSVNSLYHTESFTVSMSARDENAKIRYTTDGSKPTSHSKAYEEPLTIKKNTVLRAASFSPGLLSSEIASATYLFDEPHTLPVVSLIGDQDGIDTVYATTNRENKPERECYIQYFETNGALGTEFPAGLKAKGAGTLSYAQKSFSVHLRAAYGQSSVNYPFYDAYGYDIKTFSALALRNSGQDNQYARIKNSFFSRATLGINVDAAMTRPVVLYINGAYWGLYDLDEDINKDYLAAHYGVDENKVDIVRRNFTALAGSEDDFLAVRAIGKTGDTSSDSGFAAFAERVDVAYFTDYFIAQTYFFNNDMFNQKYWRSQDGAVKWRPVCFDQDFMFSSYSRNIMNYFFMENGVPSNNGTTSNMDIYIGLKRNKAWRQMCAERYVELIVTEFAPDRLVGILDAMAEEMRPEMARHIKRWGAPSSVSAWEKNLDSLRNAIRRRPEYALKNVKDFFNLSSDELDALVAKYTPA